MRRKREKGYWLKLKERYPNGAQAKNRAGVLRSNEHIAHVIVDKSENEYIVTYSIPKFYHDELKKAGIKL